LYPTNFSLSFDSFRSEPNDKLKFLFSMRLDLFLKASRLCPRRPLAQKLCDAGLVSINGHPAKSAHPVKPGDEITIRIRSRLQTVSVNALPGGRSVSKAEAAKLYQVLLDEEIAEPGVIAI
jgi:ribosomal 50S subunit-recycling heat shock protein